MDRVQIECRVAEIIVEQLGLMPSEATMDSKIVDDLGADSLDTIELVQSFEEVFNLDIVEEDAEKIVTVRDAVDYIEARTKA